jgi:hypothetical protein
MVSIIVKRDQLDLTDVLFCASDTIETIPVNDHERYAVMLKGTEVLK